MKYFNGIKEIQIYFDDILVCANTKSEHDLLLNEVVERTRKFNIKFNVKKLKYEVKFL